MQLTRGAVLRYFVEYNTQHVIMSYQSTFITVLREGQAATAILSLLKPVFIEVSLDAGTDSLGLDE